MTAIVWGHLCTWDDVRTETLRLILLQHYSQVGILGYCVHEEPSFPYMPVNRFLLGLEGLIPSLPRFNIASHEMLFEFGQ
jgi:hypothetical protein